MGNADVSSRLAPFDVSHALVNLVQGRALVAGMSVDIDGRAYRLTSPYRAYDRWSSRGIARFEGGTVEFEGLRVYHVDPRRVSHAEHILPVHTCTAHGWRAVDRVCPAEHRASVLDVVESRNVTTADDVAPGDFMRGRLQVYSGTVRELHGLVRRERYDGICGSCEDAGADERGRVCVAARTVDGWVTLHGVALDHLSVP